MERGPLFAHLASQLWFDGPTTPSQQNTSHGEARHRLCSHHLVLESGHP